MTTLNYKKYGQGEPLIILHGLFGALDNWATLGRKWAEHYTVYLVDLRNHGKSPHTESHTIGDMAEDVKNFIQQHDIRNPIVLGHSMGGKAAMELALSQPDLVSALIIADIGAQAYPRGHDHIIEAIRSVDPARMESRKDIEQKLSETIQDPGVVFFIAKNIDRTKEGYRWKMNIDTIERDYEEILKAIKTGRIFDKPTFLLRGGKSGYVTSENINLLRQLFPNIQIETIEGAGHWLHAEKPDEFEEQVRAIMKGV
ncbi:alpha/beta fold hydrolase [Membranicola marinus]|uniref:Alpha/beta fold hydrolase n=1 Tax=Membranihabitans marinus TaxID=1227546 RepID=A0A953L8B6_9BACT|nr:alpha/beta fold hydrolase [Membranihabitans marinus]MBY5959637.1 alpha/beta fold hydrolase [Membranihabitans marinus]